MKINTRKVTCFKHKNLFPKAIFVVNDANPNRAFSKLREYFDEKFGARVMAENVDILSLVAVEELK